MAAKLSLQFQTKTEDNAFAEATQKEAVWSDDEGVTWGELTSTFVAFLRGVGYTVDEKEVLEYMAFDCAVEDLNNSNCDSEDNLH